MPLASREVMFILRAQDQASSVIRGVGSSFGTVNTQAAAAAKSQMAQGAALMGVGTAMAGIGAAGLAMIGDFTKQASAYDKAAGLTLTQIDQIGVSLKDVKEIGLAVAREVPAALEQMQPALFDIFSSMDVPLKDARAILEGFAKAAVAGGTDVQTAGRASISIMNGFGLGADGLSEALDVQFQLVRKGVGTYEEFAKSIGRAIPSAGRMGQTVETLSGMLAFLTRETGMTPQMAATSAARAFDVMSNPTAVGRMKAMGIQVTDAAGEFLQMDEIIVNLGKKMQGLTKPEKAAALQELFKGAGGTIQARRFIDKALEDVDNYVKATDQMSDSTGAMQKAYDIMFDRPASQAQLLRNNIKILQVQFGEGLLGGLNSVIKPMIVILQWFQDLSPHTKEVIMKVALIGFGLLTLSGIIIAAVGFVMLFNGALALMGIELGAILIPAGLIVAAILAIGVIVFLLIKHWKTLKQWAEIAWNGIKDAAQATMDFIQPYWEAFWGALTSAAQTSWQILQDIWKVMVAMWQTYIMPVLKGLGGIFSTTWDMISGVVSAAWAVIKPSLAALGLVFTEVLVPILKTFGTIFGEVIGAAWQVLQWAWDNVWKPILERLWDLFKTVIIPALELLGQVFAAVWQIAWTVIETFWKIASVPLLAFVQLVKYTIAPAIQWLYDTVFKPIFEAITDVVKKFWNDGLKPVWDAIVDFAKKYLAPVVQGIADIWNTAWDGMVDGIQWIWDKIHDIFANSINFLIGAIEWFVNGVIHTVNKAIHALNVLPGPKFMDELDDVSLSRIGLKTTTVNGAIGETRSFGGITPRAVGGIFGQYQRLLVGEKGPEIVEFNRPGNVIPTGGMGGGVTIAPGAVQVVINGNPDEEQRRMIREEIESALWNLTREMRVRGNG